MTGQPLRYEAPLTPVRSAQEYANPACPRCGAMGQMSFSFRATNSRLHHFRAHCRACGGRWPLDLPAFEWRTSTLVGG